MGISRKGQVTIPRAVREKLGLTPGTEVAVEIRAGVVCIAKTKASRQFRIRGRRLVERLRGRNEFAMTTNEIVALMRGPSTDEG